MLCSGRRRSADAICGMILSSFISNTIQTLNKHVLTCGLKILSASVFVPDAWTSINMHAMAFPRQDPLKLEYFRSSFEAHPCTRRGSDYPAFVLVNKSSSQILATESLSLNLRSKPKKIPGTQIDGGGCLFRDALWPT